MSRRKKIEGLVNLSALQFQAARAEMAGLLKKENALRLNLKQLVESKGDQARAMRRPDEAAFVAGADIRWNQWVDQRRATINAELAQVLALKEHCRSKLVRAFGRDQASMGMMDNMIRTERRIMLRRQNYES